MLNPLEIKKQEFGRAMRGYDTAEVRNFLETVADEFEKTVEKARLQTTEIQSLKSELAAYKRIDQNMKEALVNAQETLRGAREGSKREADLLIKEAKLEADKIITAAQEKGKDIRRDMEMLAERRNSFIRKLKSLLRSELELIQLLEDEDLAADAESNAKKP
ncbi:MAG: DivIVA domain-containing protein [Candidatus Hatepunaea meridiana]|nr:DivIVA domain-containing protein [Candidatus Hatepunaea meridiana]